MDFIENFSKGNIDNHSNDEIKLIKRNSGSKNRRGNGQTNHEIIRK